MKAKPVFLGAAVILTFLVVTGAWLLATLLSPHHATPIERTAGLRRSPEGPATIMISCQKGERFGSTIYPILRVQCRDGSCETVGATDLAPEPAIYAHCRPDEDFTYDVQSAETEVSDSICRSEISFTLTTAGEVRDATISRSSGSRSLDLKVLNMVARRHYKPTRCGMCSVFVAPPVNLKKYWLSGQGNRAGTRE